MAISRLKVLLVCNMSPFPPQGGSPLRLWQMINVLAKIATVDVLSFGDRDVRVASMPVANSWIHIGDDVEKRRFIGAQKVRALLRARQFPFENDFRDAEFNRIIADRITDVRPDVIVLSHWRDALPDSLARAPRLIVDAHNIESLLGPHAVPRLRSFRERFAMLRFRQRERRLFKVATSVWVTSAVDAALASKMAPRADIRVVPNAVDTDHYRPLLNKRLQTVRSSVAAREGSVAVGYIGRYSYNPNAVAARRLLHAIFPRIRERCPDAHLWLVGMHPGRELVDAAAGDSHVHVTDAVEDVLPFLERFDALVVPIATASGTRLKILEAFAAGVPVVSTSKGAEGIAATPSSELCIADSDEGLAEAAVRLLDDPARVERQIVSAAALVERAYSWSSIESTVRAGVERVMASEGASAAGR